MTIGGPDINVIRFSQANLAKVVETSRRRRPEYRIGSNDEKGASVDVVLDSNHKVRLDRFGTNASVSGCDQMWIPCKAFINYRVFNGINSKQVEFKADLPWAQIASLEEREEIKDVPLYGSTVLEAKVSMLTLKMRDGTNLEARAWRQEDYRGETVYGIPHPVAFIGRDHSGVLWVFPVNTVRSIVVLP